MSTKEKLTTSNVRPATKWEYMQAAPEDRFVKDVGLERYYYVRRTK